MTKNDSNEMSDIKSDTIKFIRDFVNMIETEEAPVGESLIATAAQFIKYSENNIYDDEKKLITTITVIDAQVEALNQCIYDLNRVKGMLLLMEQAKSMLNGELH